MEQSSIKEQIAAQNTIQEIQSKNIGTSPTPPGPMAGPPTGGVCSQCGIMHPPLKPGEKCPMAPITTKDNKVVDPTNFLTKMKFIISNQLEQKGIKDVDKFFQHLTVELMKAMEDYKE